MNTIITEKMIFGGNCLAKMNGKNVFVPFALPGEKLKIEIAASKKDYDIACILEIENPSPKRIPPVCEYYGVCGGCTMMHIDYEYQTLLRKHMLEDCFSRAGIKLPDVECVAGEPLNYRARFQLHDGAMEARKTNEHVFIKHCSIAEKPVNDYLASADSVSRPEGRCHVFGSRFATPNFALAVTPQKNGRVSNSKKIKHTVQPKHQGISVNPETCVSVELCGKKIVFDIQGFFQSNLQVLEKAGCLLTDGLSGKHVLDMYGGCGTLSVFLADKFERVTLVEHNKAAVVFAEQNLFGTEHESYGVSGAKWVLYNAASSVKRNGRFDAVVLDPPRSGIEPEVIDFICREKPRVLRILSCEPSTDARDVKKLADAGYEIKRMILLDFYPQTSHIESLCCLEYNGDI